MAAVGWREKDSVAVADALFAEGHRYSFLQAVRLLEDLYPDRTPPGEGTDPRRELVRFRSKVRLDFPASDVEEIRSGDGEPAEMTVNVLGLAGVLGPLPPAVTELILERSFRKDTAFRDFLDLFNHRLVSLLYRARKKYRPALDPKAPDRGRVATVLYSLIGLGTPRLLGRLGIPDRVLLPYAGFLVDRARSNVGLVRILEDCFGAPAEIVPFQGRWHALDDQDVTLLGRRNQALGGVDAGAVLGRRVWDQAARFELRLGPMTLQRFRSFLPDGDAFGPLLAMTRFYVREELGFTLRLTLAAAEVPGLRLGRDGGARLGWTSWLKTKPFACNDSQVGITGKV
jgi:type VI secretion system protein ImpH